MRQYKYENYTLVLEVVGEDGHGKPRVRYHLFDQDGTIFEGNDFYSWDGSDPKSAEGLLGFLTLRQGDVEEDYFKDYTERQLKFRDNEAEDLYFWQEELNPEAYKE